MTAMPTQAPTPNGPAPARGTILLVEDDEVIAQLFMRILRGAGFPVAVCRTGLEALRLLKTERVVDVVLSDIGLPFLRGDQLALQIGAIRPGLPVLLMTGFCGSVTAENAHRFGVSSVLQKPIAPRELLRAIDEALSGVPVYPSSSHAGTSFEVARR
jgi:DNA-binding NtrC family response regulator